MASVAAKVPARPGAWSQSDHERANAKQACRIKIRQRDSLTAATAVDLIIANDQAQGRDGAGGINEDTQ